MSVVIPAFCASVVSSAAELAALAQKAGITTLTVRAYPLYGRLVAVAA